MNHINLDNYQGDVLGGDGFGGSSAEELLKAMQAGQITGRDTTDLALTGEPLKAESLEKTLKLLDFRQKDIRLFNALPKLTAFNTVEEYLQLQSYGNNRGGFYNEGELSNVEDSTYIRKAEHVKYIQVTGEVTMQAQMVQSYVDVMRKEVENKVNWVTRKANAALTKGNSAIIPQEWNSLYTQHAAVGVNQVYSSLDEYYDSANVIDLRGASLKQEDVEDGAIVIDDNFGTATHLFAPPSVLSALSKDYFQDQRIMLNANNEDSYIGKIGTVAKVISTTLGDVALEPDKFMKRDAGKLLADPASDAKAPAAVTSNSAAVAAGDAESEFLAGEAGAAFYAVSAINRYGESALTQIGTAVAIAAGSSIDLDFTAGTGAFAANGFKIYRTEIGAANTDKFYPIFEVGVAQKAAGYDGAAAGVVRDRGRVLPNLEEAFMIQMDTEVVSFKQLAPISKLDLAVLSMSRRFIVFLFGTPILYAPKKMVKFVNCAKTLTN